MRNSTVLLLCLFIFLDGCYSHFARKHIDASELQNSDHVLITLEDGSVIEIEPWHHVNVSEPSDFVYGVGRRIHRFTKKESQFIGELPIHALDSLTINKVGVLNIVICYLPDSTMIQFQGKDNVVVRAMDGVGFFGVGVIEPPRNTQNVRFSRMIPTKEIKQIESPQNSQKTRFSGKIPTKDIKQIEKSSDFTTFVILGGTLGISILLMIMSNFPTGL